MTSAPLSRGNTSRDIYRQIFDAEYPEQYIRTIPAQSLYLLIKQRGIASAAELIELATIEQCRLFLDFDLWEKDQFREENVWEWLALTDDEDPLKFTQKFLKSVDLKLISLLISKYVEIKVFDEPTENPPIVGWHTPDKGYTWIHVIAEDSTIYFHLNRLLALIFETSTELFYQLLSIPSVSTGSVLEEEAFQDRGRRLAGEGMPDFAHIEEINSSLLPFEAKKILSEAKKQAPVQDIPSIEPLLYDTLLTLEPLTGALSRFSDKESLEGELTLIMNASLHFFSVPVYAYEEVLKHTRKVKGALNIGMEKACSLASVTPDEAILYLGLSKLYRLGLFELRLLRKEALAFPFDELKVISKDQKLFSVIAAARESFPEIPEWIIQEELDLQETEQNKLSGVSVEILNLNTIEKAKKLLVRH